MQLDVFHALWELHHGAECQSRPPGVPTRGEKERNSREEELKTHPTGTKIRKEFAGIQDRRNVFVVEVYDFSDPY